MSDGMVEQETVVDFGVEAFCSGWISKEEMRKVFLKYKQNYVT